MYSDDPKLCCFLGNTNVCHDHINIQLRCSLLLSPAILKIILVFTTIAILFFTTCSFWLVAKTFGISRSVQRLLHNSILINRSLCVFCVLVIVVVDVFHGKHYIMWYRSLSSKLLCQALQVIISSGIMMSNISTSLLDHITYMAVSRMLFNENDVHGIVKKLLCLMHFLVMTVFSLIAYVLNKELDPRFSKNHLCDVALGVHFNDHAWSVTGPVFLSIGVILSLTHSICSYTAILKNVYSSGKRMQTMAPTKSINAELGS